MVSKTPERKRLNLHGLVSSLARDLRLILEQDGEADYYISFADGAGQPAFIAFYKRDETADELSAKVKEENKKEEGGV